MVQMLLPPPSLTRMLLWNCLLFMKTWQSYEIMLLWFQVFQLLREQLWYRPNSGVYIKLIVMLGKCKQPEKALELFQAMVDEFVLWIVNHTLHCYLPTAEVVSWRELSLFLRKWRVHLVVSQMSRLTQSS